MFSVSGAGKYFSLSSVRGDVAKCRLGEYSGRWTKQQLEHVLKAGELEVSTRAWATWASCTETPLLKSVVDVDRADANIDAAYVC